MKLRFLFASLAVFLAPALARAEDWTQFKFDARHSGDAADRAIDPPTLGLEGAVALTDAIYTAPVISGGRIYAVDGAGVAFCIDAATREIVWKTATRGGPGNCNNVSSPAIAGEYLHFGTTAGIYYVLNRADGRVAEELDLRDPIFSAPAVSGDRVYVVTLGAQVLALDFDGTRRWTWDFVKEVIGFPGNRWSGEEWYAHKNGRVTWQDHFCASRNLAANGKTIVVPAGGRVVFLEDGGDAPRVRIVGEIPNVHGNEYPAAFGLSLGGDGAAYVQWHRRDNAARTEILRLKDDDTLEFGMVPGTETYIDAPGLMSFSSVSLRGDDIFRTRPEEGFALCRHRADREEAEPLGGYPSICPPVLAGDHAIFGGLDGALHVVPLSGRGEAWKFQTPFGVPVTAAAAVADGRVVFGGEDGYLYVLGPNGTAKASDLKALDRHEIRTPLSGKFTDPKYDWYTNYGDMGCTNANEQAIEPPLRMRWIRRNEGTVKHIPVCGGGRMYTHTAEGQVIAVEQETGRQLWRRYTPGAFLTFTSPLYHEEKLLIPQMGIGRSVIECLDAATGALLWEAPVTGSASWSRQFPPVIHRNLVIYASGSGSYAPAGNEKAYAWRAVTEKPEGDTKEVMSFIYSHNNPYYPEDNHPMIWAWDLGTGKLVWEKDFSEHGAGGNDCGIALMDGELYYSTFFGYQAGKRQRRGQTGGANGLTARLDPESGEVRWATTDYYVTAGCTVTAKDGRIYLGGFNQPVDETKDRYIHCLDAKDGSLVWRSDPVDSAINVISVGDKYLFSNARGSLCSLFDRDTGKAAYQFDLDYACTRFTLSEPFLMGANMDMIDLRDGHKLVATGPAIDSRECLGSAVSNGRIFYISQASGLIMSAVCGEDAKRLAPAWETR
ncbi:MAG: PQQ-binding-like beta-propeller repeat protein [Verrucomicrobiae bacterium]|nr:PQQ-binding-like beta-propeller repeat protein [Verrucomicrobiae bacterium]MCP5541019.1 PQQ-binding-like beta-propeller repeat protein [Akkermansiaceae bacterium]MCP5551538.1 PQQ-binding-like beta-propeller repeat protein [Akkermansiaceae bacterium]